MPFWKKNKLKKETKVLSWWLFDEEGRPFQEGDKLKDYVVKCVFPPRLAHSPTGFYYDPDYITQNFVELIEGASSQEAMDLRFFADAQIYTDRVRQEIEEIKTRKDNIISMDIYKKERISE